MKLLIGITLVVVVVSSQRVKRGGEELSFGGDLGHDFGGHGDLGGHHEVHGVATSYQNVHLESHNPVPVIIHKAEEHHHGLEGHHELSLEGHSGGGFEGLGHGLSLEEHQGFEGHGLGGLELHGFEGHEGY
ncbi:hypothetical protein C0J52_22465 [Blattella germanica]|nr:hypothetical protein C0J52_22465 [Blattella germanica]